MRYVALTICYLALYTVIGYATAISNEPAWLILLLFVRPVISSNYNCEEKD